MAAPDRPTVYVDESNNTGENLMDLSQPVYVVAGVMMERGEAVDMLDAARNQLPAGFGELKFSKLMKSHAGQTAISVALKGMPKGSAFTYPADKRYMIVGKMVDNLTVEMAHATGYDMYADGSAVGLANLIHAVGPSAGDPHLFDSMLSKFVGAVRMNQTATLDELFQAIDRYRLSVRYASFATQFEMFSLARPYLEDFVAQIAAGSVRDSLDPAVTCLVWLCRAIDDQVGSFHLVHDESKSIQQNLQLLSSLDTLPPVTPGLLPRAFPALDVVFADSVQTPQLQIADWVAGATRFVAMAETTGQRSALSSKLLPIADSWLTGSLFPDPELITSPRRIPPSGESERQ